MVWWKSKSFSINKRCSSFHKNSKNGQIWIFEGLMQLNFILPMPWEGIQKAKALSWEWHLMLSNKHSRQRDTTLRTSSSCSLYNAIVSVLKMKPGGLDCSWGEAIYFLRSFDGLRPPRCLRGCNFAPGRGLAVSPEPLMPQARLVVSIIPGPSG